MVRKSLLVCICLGGALGLNLRALRADDTVSAGSTMQKLVGTWKRIGSLDKNGKMIPRSENYTRFKFVTLTHFVWFSVNPKTHQAAMGLSGRCTAKGNTYTESIDLVAGKPEDVMQPADPAMKNRAIPPTSIPPAVCKCRLQGSRWYHEVPGFLFRDKVTRIEVWERLKPGEKMF